MLAANAFPPFRLAYASATANALATTTVQSSGKQTLTPTPCRPPSDP
jgi:hypothetical protein